MDKWLIWSNEHLGWWGPNEQGYTTKIDKAGRYMLSEAIRICVESNEFPYIKNIPNEVIVPSPELIEELKQIENTLGGAK